MIPSGPNRPARTHGRNLMAALEARTRAQAVSIAMRKGYID